MTTMYRVTDPATGQVAEEFPTATDAEIRRGLEILDEALVAVAPGVPAH